MTNKVLDENELLKKQVLILKNALDIIILYKNIDEISFDDALIMVDIAERAIKEFNAQQQI